MYNDRFIILVIILLPFLASVFVIITVERIGLIKSSLIYSTIPAFCFGLLYYNFIYEPHLSNHSVLPYAVKHEFIKALDIGLDFYVDQLSLTFALIISGIGFLIIIFAGGYMRINSSGGRLLSMLLVFMGSMLGLVLADDLFIFFVFWELTAISSYILIGHNYEKTASRRNAFQALLITGGGGLCLLASLVVMGSVFDVTRMSDLLPLRDQIVTSEIYVLLVAGFFLAIATKSAQFPFQIWLPNAMVAPTPVSSYLHSATMVKAGIYLLYRLSPIMGGTDLWVHLFMFVGLCTAVIGIISAYVATDIKRILAFSTISSLGLLVFVGSLGTKEGFYASGEYLLAHAFFKGGLFMIAGCIFYSYRTSNLSQIRSKFMEIPFLGIVMLLLAMSLAAIPGTFGYHAKESIIYSILMFGKYDFLIYFIILIGGFSIAVAFNLVSWMIMSRNSDVKEPKLKAKVDIYIILGPLILLIITWLMGLKIISFDLISSFKLLVPGSISGAVDLVDGVNKLDDYGLLGSRVSNISYASMFLGLVLILLSRFVYPALELLSKTMCISDKIFDVTIQGLFEFSALLNRFFERMRLDHMIATIFVVLSVFFWVQIIYLDKPIYISGDLGNNSHIFAVLFTSISLFALLFMKNRLKLVAAMGIQGYMLAIIFILLGAPDVSFTQFMVETLSVVILALMITRFRLNISDPVSVNRNIFKIFCSIMLGGGIFIVLLAYVSVPFDARVSNAYFVSSYLLAHGKNIVNVILVDFRALDTLGEISVFFTVGIAVAAILAAVGSKRLSLRDQDN